MWSMWIRFPVVFLASTTVSGGGQITPLQQWSSGGLRQLLDGASGRCRARVGTRNGTKSELQTRLSDARILAVSVGRDFLIGIKSKQMLDTAAKSLSFYHVF
jgi:hypothetical protein